MSISFIVRTVSVALFLLVVCIQSEVLAAEENPMVFNLAEGAETQGLDVDDEIRMIGYCKSDSCDCGSACGCDCGSACGYGCGCCAKSPYYGMVDFIAYGRDNDSSRRRLLEDSGSNPLLYTDDLDFDFAPGVRARLGMHNGPCHHCDSYEIEYLGIFNWDASGQITNSNNIFLPGALGFAVNGFQSADVVDVRYKSDLHSLELNCVQCCCQSCCCGRWTRIESICGIRYLRLGEDFTLSTNNVPPPPAVDAIYDVDVDNNLYGAQLGARITRWRNRGFGFECVCKAGIYGNDARQKQYIVDNIGATPFNFRPQTGASKGNVAFVGELSFIPTYRVSDTWSLRCGYNILWIEGVALAPDQLDFTDTPTSGTTIDTNGGVFAHGVSVGAEARF